MASVMELIILPRPLFKVFPIFPIDVTARYTLNIEAMPRNPMIKVPRFSPPTLSTKPFTFAPKFVRKSPAPSAVLEASSTVPPESATSLIGNSMERIFSPNPLASIGPPAKYSLRLMLSAVSLSPRSAKN